ncbi:MAG: RyR domain-containing protein [Candidatus Sericytochromatia bacterium]|nr:RyR domain-containing protein [Candidatus Sericytochromatia bacterium]
MEFEKIAEASHQAWFVAMARQGWVFGPRLSQEFKTHPWLKAYPGLSDQTKEIVRAQVRGTLQALEGQGLSDLKGLVASAPAPAAVTPARATVVAREPASPPESRPVAPSVAAPAPPAVDESVKKNPPTPTSNGQVLERKVDASGRMRIGSGLVKKAELLRGGVNQVTITQSGSCIEVSPYDPNAAGAFYASVNPDGFMLPKAMLAGAGSQDFTLTILPGRLVVQPK